VREEQAEMNTIMSHLDLLHNADTRGWGAPVKPLRNTALGPVRPLMWLLMGTVGFVLLIACGNAANLLLARAAARTHELGVRATLGARRSRLLLQVLTESLMLSTGEGTVGIGLAWLFLRALLKLNPEDIPRMDDARPDLRVMGFAVFATVLTSALFGMREFQATGAECGMGWQWLRSLSWLCRDCCLFDPEFAGGCRRSHQRVTSRMIGPEGASGKQPYYHERALGWSISRVHGRFGFLLYCSMSFNVTACDVEPLMAFMVRVDVTAVGAAGLLDEQPLSPTTAPALSSKSKPNIA